MEIATLTMTIITSVFLVIGTVVTIWWTMHSYVSKRKSYFIKQLNLFVSYNQKLFKDHNVSLDDYIAQLSYLMTSTIMSSDIIKFYKVNNNGDEEVTDIKLFGAVQNILHLKIYKINRNKEIKQSINSLLKHLNGYVDQVNDWYETSKDLGRLINPEDFIGGNKYDFYYENVRLISEIFKAIKSKEVADE